MSGSTSFSFRNKNNPTAKAYINKEIIKIAEFCDLYVVFSLVMFSKLIIVSPSPPMYDVLK
jgi:hypothetical protein